ncbi:hypothetical protein [Georgfuchsia toluolica]|uniref:hypothetical protein n=1 Tax=Georgfuchsia toluolica TaxID=424218 RepID=UPI001C732DC8|nr:hypothetical protein [Georgfuchsia toluolica]
MELVQHLPLHAFVERQLLRILDEHAGHAFAPLIASEHDILRRVGSVTAGRDIHGHE